MSTDVFRRYIDILTEADQQSQYHPLVTDIDSLGLTFQPTTKKDLTYSPVQSPLNQENLDQMPALSFGTSADNFVLQTVTDDGHETTKPVNQGDVIVSGPGKEKYNIGNQAKFDKNYPIDAGNGRRKPDIKSVRQVAQYTGQKPISIMASWGEQMNVLPGDYIVNEAPGKYYRVAKYLFDQTYNALGRKQQGVAEGLAPGQAAWKKEMTAKGAVSFKRDQHGGGTVDRIVAYDKDGKVVGGFNRKSVAEGTKALADYIAESERAYSQPVPGDWFAINIREETLFETWVCDETPDGIVIYADDAGLALLERYGYLGEAISEGHDFEIDSDEDSVDVVDQGEYDQEGDMAKDDLATIVRAARRLTGMLDDNDNLPEWVQAKITKAADYVDTAADYMESNREQDMAEGFGTDPTQPGTWHGHKIVANRKTPKGSFLIIQNKNDSKYEIHRQNPGAVGGLEFVSAHKTPEEMQTAFRQLTGVDESNQGMAEAKYQGREVPLGKPMKGDVKKSKVYVRGPKGNVVKVNFGQKGMKIKKNIPGRRKNFRARHNCANPGPRWKARYWSCRAW